MILNFKGSGFSHFISYIGYSCKGWGFTIFCDAFGISLCSILMQQGCIIDYELRQLKVHECNYATNVFELVALALALKIRGNFLHAMYCEIYTHHLSLIHLIHLWEINYRQQIWMELLMDYAISILYHSGKANLVANILSQKVLSIVCSASILIFERPLVWDIQSFTNRMV